MKILVMSDSHGVTKEINDLKVRHRDDVNYFIHCGDSELFRSEKVLANVRTVRGNCDLDSSFNEDEIIEFYNWKVFVTHGHNYGVRSSLQSLSYRAEEVGAQIVCYGHTHILHLEKINGILFVNPGSIRLPRVNREKTYVILSLNENDLHVSVREVMTGDVMFEEMELKF